MGIAIDVIAPAGATGRIGVVEARAKVESVKGQVYSINPKPFSTSFISRLNSPDFIISLILKIALCHFLSLDGK
ncbi:MAG: hypothetical protein ACJA0S_001412 [Rickettsiales bacterium]